MKRRDFVKALVASSLGAKAMLGQQQPPAPPVSPAVQPPTPTAPGPVPWMRGLHDAKQLDIAALTPDAVAQTAPHFFTSQQMATLRRLSHVLLPPLNEYPGALDAQTPEFLDFLISVSPDDRKTSYRQGLDRLDREAKAKFGKTFAMVDDEQADQILKPWLRTWMNDHPPTEPFEQFINVAHSDIRSATINSEAWNKAAGPAGENTPDQGLYWYPIDPEIGSNDSAFSCKPATPGRHVPGQRPRQGSTPPAPVAKPRSQSQTN